MANTQRKLKTSTRKDLEPSISSPSPTPDFQSLVTSSTSSLLRRCDAPCFLGFRDTSPGSPPIIDPSVSKFQIQYINNPSVHPSHATHPPCRWDDPDPRVMGAAIKQCCNIHSCCYRSKSVAAGPESHLSVADWLTGWMDDLRRLLHTIISVYSAGFKEWVKYLVVAMG